jgi:hypothetical protein
MDAQADLAHLQRDLAAMAARVERGLGERGSDPRAPSPDRRRTGPDRTRFTRASMRDRPVAALFDASAERG